MFFFFTWKSLFTQTEENIFGVHELAFRLDFNFDGKLLCWLILSLYCFGFSVGATKVPSVSFIGATRNRRDDLVWWFFTVVNSAKINNNNSVYYVFGITNIRVSYSYTNKKEIWKNVFLLSTFISTNLFKTKVHFDASFMCFYLVGKNQRN